MLEFLFQAGNSLATARVRQLCSTNPTCKSRLAVPFTIFTQSIRAFRASRCTLACPRLLR